MTLLYAEPGSTWWPLVFGPAFALVGGGVEALSGPVHVVAWVVVGVGLFACTLLWVRARRSVCRVALSEDALLQGRESLSTNEIVDVPDIDPPTGARVLGGGWTVPNKFREVPLKLADDTVVLAWARDPDALRAALRPLVGS